MNTLTDPRPSLPSIYVVSGRLVDCPKCKIKVLYSIIKVFLLHSVGEFYLWRKSPSVPHVGWIGFVDSCLHKGSIVLSLLLLFNFFLSSLEFIEKAVHHSVSDASWDFVNPRHLGPPRSRLLPSSRPVAPSVHWLPKDWVQRQGVLKSQLEVSSPQCRSLLGGLVESERDGPSESLRESRARSLVRETKPLFLLFIYLLLGHKGKAPEGRRSERWDREGVCRRYRLTLLSSV